MSNNRLLILTNSLDGTADLLIHFCRTRNIGTFRWNIDLWSDYEISFSSKLAVIVDPLGNELNLYDPDLALLWRKPFPSEMYVNDAFKLNEADKNQARNQIREWLRTVVAIFAVDQRIHLIEPFADIRLPKLLQLRIAKTVFSVPEYNFSINGKENNLRQPVIAKPLADPSVGENRIFYTSLVDADNLQRPFPWFLQDAIIGGTDVTCVYIDGDCFFYECEFSRSEINIDWRVEINSNTQSVWIPFINSKICDYEKQVAVLMQKLSLTFGRLDFIYFDDNLYFLECNSNGQFGWLDDPDHFALHNRFLDAALNTQIPQI